MDGALGALPLDLALREARDAFERVYFEYHIAARAREHEPGGRPRRTGAHAPVPQAQAARHQAAAQGVVHVALLHRVRAIMPNKLARALAVIAHPPATNSMATRQDLANAIRALAMDAVQKANSGHPGMPMGMADIAEVLWNHHLRFNPANPAWPDRDRFVLSNGHGSMLLYALLHLTGFDLPMDEIERFRQLHSKTPGHPEHGMTPGVETTTGPLGPGLRQRGRAWRSPSACSPPSSTVPGSRSSIITPTCSWATAA